LTPVEIRDLVIAGAGIGALALLLVVVILVRWSSRKKRAVSVEEEAAPTSQPDRAIAVEPLAEPAGVPPATSPVASQGEAAGAAQPVEAEFERASEPPRVELERSDEEPSAPSASSTRSESPRVAVQKEAPQLEPLASPTEPDLLQVGGQENTPNGLAHQPEERAEEPAVERKPEKPAEGRDGEASKGELGAIAQPAPDKAQPTPDPTPAAPDTAPAAMPASNGVKSDASAAPSRIPFALRRTRERFLARLRSVLAGTKQIEEICEGLEEVLIDADVGVETSLKLIEAIRARLKRGACAEAVREALKEEIANVLKAVAKPPANPAQPPLVVVVVGVNGVGKTTTVAKLAAYFKAQRGSVIVGAADTFRAAAIEQLEVWCKRADVDLVKHRPGGDPAAVAFDTVKAAVARRVPVALIDTAGRLQTKVNLMEELKKIVRVIGREIPDAPQEVWMVLDATTGQNALSQAKLFSEAVHLTGVVLTKLDSSAKGGVVLAIADRLGLAVRFVGVGEGLEDLRPFDERDFIEGMFENEAKSEPLMVGAYQA
jgi:fused signal recognition particle receptor